MTGRSRGEAIRRLVESLQRQLTAVTQENQLLLHSRGAPGRFLVAAPQERAVRMRRTPGLWIRVGTEIALTDSAIVGRDRWAAVPGGYYFSILSDGATELITFHWHPGVPSQPGPHLHLGAASGATALLRRAHIPGATVTLATVLRFAIRELGVDPVRRDWEAILTDE